jgi:integrase/recombinase XerC
MQTADMADAMNRWTLFIEGTPKTVETYTRAIGQFQKWCVTNNVSMPTKEDIRSFRDDLSARCKPTTVNSYLAAIKVFFKWMEEEGRYPNIAQNVKGVKLSKEHKKDELTATQAKKLLDSIDRSTLVGKRDYAIISLMLTTGARDIEIHRANIGDLRPLGDFTALYYQGKGRAERAEFKKIAPVVEESIREYLNERGDHDDESPLFISIANRNKGGRLTTKSISRAVKGRLRAAGFDSPRWTAHSLRHTAAMIALLNGASLEEIQSMMDHASIGTTMIYAGHASKAQRQAEQKIASAIF